MRFGPHIGSCCVWPLIRPSGTFSRWKKREKAKLKSLRPPLLAGEGGRQAG